MRKAWQVAAVGATCVVLSACTDRPSAAPTAPLPPRANLSSSALPATCDVANLTSLANGYAASSSDPLFAIISGLSSVGFHGASPATTDLDFDGLSRLAAMRGTSAQKSGAMGTTFDGLTKGLLACAESYITATVPSDFSVAGALMAGFMFEVRGDNSQDAPTAGAYERGSTPYWAAEPESGNTWGSSLHVTAPATTTATNRVLFYGFLLPNFATLDPKVAAAFEISTIPTVGSGVLSLTPAINIGLCGVDASVTARVEHVVTVLPNAGLSCATPPVFAMASPSFGQTLASPRLLASRAIDFFAPKRLEAAFIAGSVGGAVSELSPSAVIDMQKVTMNFKLVIQDGNKSSPLQGEGGGSVKVVVTTKNGTPLGAATVTLDVAGNNGKNALFKDGSAPPSETVTRTTDANGVADFAGVFVTKAGGYRIDATGSFDGVVGIPVTSNLFNIKNK
jgi:hypothetical protein